MESVVITGYETHAAYLAGLLNGYTAVHAAFYPNTRLSRYRAFAHASWATAAITFGGPRPKPVIEALCHARRRPAIVVWAGTDVTALRTSGERDALRDQSLIHWAAGPNLAEELRELGIHARMVPVASAALPEQPARMPQTFTVLAYLPEPRRAFYGEQAVWQAAYALPRARFLVVGRGAASPSAPPNVSYLGHVSGMQAVLDSSSVLLRLTEHDNALCQGVIEALARGRHVIWTYAFPGVAKAGSPAQAIGMLERLYSAHCSGALGINRAGMTYVAGAHDPRRIADGIVRALHDAARACRRSNRSPVRKPFAQEHPIFTLCDEDARKRQ